MNTQSLSPAQRAWMTRRAKAAVNGSTAITTVAPVAIAAPVGPAQPTPAPRPYVEPEWMRPKTATQKAVAASAADVFVAADRAEVVELYVDDRVMGCGFHRFLVLERSERMVRLFNVPKLAAITVSTIAFKKARTPRFPVRRRVLVDILNRNRAMVDRINDRARDEIMKDGGVYADRALALLTA